MADRVQVRQIDDAEGQRLLRIIGRSTGSEVTFASDDRVRDVIHHFNADGFDSLCPKYKGGRPKTFVLPKRRETKQVAKSKSAEHNLPFSTWSLTKPADFLVR